MEPGCGSHVPGCGRSGRPCPTWNRGAEHAASRCSWSSRLRASRWHTVSVSRAELWASWVPHRAWKVTPVLRRPVRGAASLAAAHAPLPRQCGCQRPVQDQGSPLGRMGTLCGIWFWEHCSVYSLAQDLPSRFAKA